jgi:hypothetical protein
MSTPSQARSLRLIACLALAAPWCAAADAEAPATSGSLVSEEDKWVFTPPAGRPDVFYDYEQILVFEQRIQQPDSGTDGTKSHEPAPTEDPTEFAKQSVQRIEVAMSQRKWDDAIKICDQAIKKLAGMPSNPEVAKYLQEIKGYQDQAQDALLRDEAQAAFDALNLKVEGILWSENGPRLAIIGGEPRALGINDRVKDCVIINIDTDRVDFRYHYKRKRFEFPRYVGEDAKK